MLRAVGVGSCISVIVIICQHYHKILLTFQAMSKSISDRQFGLNHDIKRGKNIFYSLENQCFYYIACI